MLKNKNKNGYTIIETMIAVSLFLVVTMAGMTALLNANLVQKKTQNMRSIMDSLNFIVEDMSRNLRVGYNYHCISSGGVGGQITEPQSCLSGGVIAFESDLGNPASDTDQWMYKIESPDGFQPFNIYKSVDSGSNWVQLNPSEVTIDPSSFFSVSGAEAPPDTDQPFVTIKLKGNITFKNVTTPFYIRTAVSQRVIDI
jgi:type II secretory pathway pseudopilin PulG